MLHLVVLSGDIPTIQLVLECSNESLTNLQDKDGNSALHLAIVLGREDIVQTLLFYYPDMNVRNKQGETVLYGAAKLHAWNLFLLLCKNGAKIDDLSQFQGIRKSESEVDSWLVVVYRDRHVETLQWLIENGADWNNIDSKV